MNKDQVKGAIKNAAGKVQEGTGKLRFKGVKKQVEGRAQKAVGDIKEAVKDSTRK